MSKRFSIIIPAHNSVRYISKALTSIKEQSFTDYELIVVCDDCTDGTDILARDFGATVKNVKFNNDGLTRSFGLDMAKGEYVLFMDDDDWWLHQYVLEQIDNKIRETKNPDILCFSFIFNGVCYAKPVRSNGSHWIAVWNKCWKREFIGDTRFPNVYSVSDSYFHKDMFSKRGRIVDWDMPMYFYNYLRTGSITEKSGMTLERTKRAVRV